MAYTFDQIFAADPSNPGNVAANGVVTIFAPGDASQTPLQIMDTAGNPLANPVTVNANGYGDAFSHATLDRVAWAGGGFSGFFTSYEGLKDEAVAARAAAEEALGGVPARVTQEVAAVAATGAFKGDPGQDGRDGSNVVPTAEAIAAEIETPGTPANTALSATVAEGIEGSNYLPATYATRGDIFMSTATALREGIASFGISAQGDSTTTPDTAWFRLLANEVASEFPSFHHRYRKWNDAAQRFDAPIALTPEGTRRGMSMSAGTSSQRDGAQITGANITGDIEIDFFMTHPAWASGETQCIAHKWTDDFQRSWILYLLPTGTVRFVWYTDGVTAGGDRTSTAVVPFANGTPGWIRASLDVDNGAGGHDVKFFTSTDRVTWTQLGTTITATGVTSIFGGTSRYAWGRRGSNALSTGTVIHEIHVKDGLNGFGVVPILPELWSQGIGQYQATPVGKPVVEWVMGAHPGAGLGYDYQTTGYLLAVNRAKKMSLNVGSLVTFFNSSHNEYNLTGKAWQEKYMQWVNESTADKPTTARVALTQNPRTGTAAASGADHGHKARRAAMLNLARRGLGVDAIDTYQAFLDDGRDLATALISDGVHPTSAGYVVEKNAIKAELAAALKRV